MKVLVLSNVIPRMLGNHKNGAEVVTYEILRLLALDPDFQLAYARVVFGNSKNEEGIAADVHPVTVLKPVILDRPASAKSWWARNVRRIAGSDMIGGLGQHDKIISACGSWVPDVILTIWSEVATAAASTLKIPIVAYYGNPDHKSLQAHIAIEKRWQNSRSLPWFARQIVDRMMCRRFEAAHIKLMRSLSCVAEVHANDAAYYRGRHVNAYYTRSMWPASASANWRDRRDENEQVSPIKIAANVGSLAGTANTFGLWTIGEELLSAFKQEIGEGNFEFHVYGPKSPQDFLVPMLADPAIKVRGFVEDLDTELFSCPVYIVANNRHDYKAGHNRFLHAWASGACVVTWRDSARAMPEIIHDRNALLAEDAVQFARLVLRAARDRNLRRRLGEGGRQTLTEYYDSTVVVRQIGDLLRNVSSKAI
jgi:glycosyltransferase involved in cell wall biosynthesis